MKADLEAAINGIKSNTDIAQGNIDRLQNWSNEIDR
jgi:hypothetical protein